MPNKNRNLATAYTRGMEWHDRGYALFHPVSTEAMKPPCAGYFDNRGKWHLITRLKKQPEDPQWNRSEYTYLGIKPQGQPVAAESWGVQKTTDAYDTAVGFKAGTPDLSAFGIPAQFVVETRWRTASDMGALLVTAPKVIHEDFNEGFNKPYKMWVKENFDTLLSHGENEMRRYGLWIIMETYSTQACMIQTWTGKTREVKLALEANAIMAGQLGPSIEWSRNRNSEDLSAYIGEGYGGRVVVFCNGLRYRFARRWEGVKRQPYPKEDFYSRMSRLDNLEAKEHIEKKEHIHTKATRTSGSAENIKNIEASDGSRYDLLATSFDLEDDDDESEEETELQQAGNKASSKQLYEKPSTTAAERVMISTYASDATWTDV